MGVILHFPPAPHGLSSHWRRRGESFGMHLKIRWVFFWFHFCYEFEEHLSSKEGIKSFCHTFEEDRSSKVEHNHFTADSRSKALRKRNKIAVFDKNLRQNCLVYWCMYFLVCICVYSVHIHLCLRILVLCKMLSKQNRYVIGCLLLRNCILISGCYS